VAPKTLSSWVLKVKDEPKYGNKLDVYIAKNTPLPCISEMHPYEPVERDQTIIYVPVIEGETDDIEHPYL